MLLKPGQRGVFGLAARQGELVMSRPRVDAGAANVLNEMD
jgi:hypothetical protein